MGFDPTMTNSFSFRGEAPGLIHVTYYEESPPGSQEPYRKVTEPVVIIQERS